jgi:hypothetical protein
MPQPPLGDVLRLYTTIRFTPNLPAGFNQCEDQSICGPLAFSQPADPAGSGFMGAFTANGINIPTFPGMTLAPGSGSWNNTAGTVNSVQIKYQPPWCPEQYYSFSANATTATIPCVTSITCVHGSNPTVVINTGGSALNTEYVPDVSRFSVQRTPGTPPPVTPGASNLVVTGVALTSDSITLSLQGTIFSNDVVTLSYAPLQPGTPPYDLSVQDSNANLLAAITGAAVTVS